MPAGCESDWIRFSLGLVLWSIVIGCCAQRPSARARDWRSFHHSAHAGNQQTKDLLTPRVLLYYLTRLIYRQRFFVTSSINVSWYFHRSFVKDTTILHNRITNDLQCRIIESKSSVATGWVGSGKCNEPSAVSRARTDVRTVRQYHGRRKGACLCFIISDLSESSIYACVVAGRWSVCIMQL